MRRALGPDGVCLFKVSEFHSKSRPTSRVVQPGCANNFPMMPISGQENKQTTLLEQGETAMAITLQHPIAFDQDDICAMAKGRSLDRFKLSTLQSTCQKLELEVPPKPIRRKRVYLDLLEKAVNNCTCHKPVDWNFKFLCHISTITNEPCAAVTRDRIKCVFNCCTNIFKQNFKIYSYSIFCHAALDRGSIAL